MNKIVNLPRLVGIDLGTSSLKVVLLNDAGRVLSVATADYPILSRAPGEAEQDPETWWAALRSALAQALARCDGHGTSLVGISFSGQMHGIVALDKHERPLRPAILWADQRGADEVAQIEQVIDRAEVVQHTGSRASVGFSAPKIMWLRQHEPQTFAQCTRLLQPKDYLRLRLTGEVATEPTDASATLLFDLAERDWSATMLQRLELPRTLFAPVQPTLGQVGVVSNAAATELNIPAGIPVIAGAGDTPAQAVGYGVLQPNRVLATISSGGQLFAALDQPLVDGAGRVHTLCHVTPERWYVLGAIQAAGLALRWFRDQLLAEQSPRSYESLTRDAAKVPAGSGGLVFLPYLLGERTPYMDNEARAVFFGFTLQHDQAAATRAVMEGVAFAFRDALRVFEELGVGMDAVYLGGGGSRSPVWRSIFADVLGTPVVLTDAEQGAALGAALLAGVGIGQFRDLAEATRATVRITDTIEPNLERAATYDALYGVYHELYASLRDHFKALASFR